MRVQATIVCSYTYGNGITLSVSEEGDVYSLGTHHLHAHGHQEKLISIPTKIPCLKNIQSGHCGSRHTICLDSDGNVFTFGCNEQSQLGIGKDGSVLSLTQQPQKVNLPRIKQISCGDSFNICLTDDNIPYSFGSNYNGQLGIGDIGKTMCHPQKISCLENIDFIECGGNHVMCRAFDNSLYGWGRNCLGEVGLSNKVDQIVFLPVKIPNFPDDIVDIKCEYHTLVLTSSQDVYSCGENAHKQLGRKTKKRYSCTLKKIPDLCNISRIECGYFHSTCIDTNLNLWVFGQNYCGQLGLIQATDIEIPTKHPTLSNIIDISTSGNNTFVKISNNEIYAFGDNEYSQLGIKTENDSQRTPIRVFEGNEDIWYSKRIKSKAKSARFILPRPSEENNSPPKKKQKHNIHEKLK